MLQIAFESEHCAKLAQLVQEWTVSHLCILQVVLRLHVKNFHSSKDPHLSISFITDVQSIGFPLEENE